MKLREIGERELIERISRKIDVKNADVIAGIGDDAAVIKSRRDEYTLIASDMLIENAHFSTKTMGFSEIGHKALAVNLSDIAAMGGEPEYFLISLGLNEKIGVEDVDELYRGMLSLAREYGVELIGGDTNYSSSDIVIDVCVIGKVKPESMCLRSGARVGDSILVTGNLGGAAARLHRGKYISPTPRLKEAKVILETARVNSMIDISDGMARDLSHIVQSSKVGAIIYAENIPVSSEADIKLALEGGEDFELLLTVLENDRDKLLREIPEKTGTALTHVGQITEKGMKIRYTDGKIHQLRPGGYEHFKNNKKS